MHAEWYTASQNEHIITHSSDSSGTEQSQQTPSILVAVADRCHRTQEQTQEYSKVRKGCGEQLKAGLPETAYVTAKRQFDEN